MSRKQQKRTAEELLGLGFSHQQALDQLMVEYPSVKPGRLAEFLRYLPTVYAKERYAQHHRLLLGLILLSGAVRIWYSIGQVNGNWAQAYGFISLVPIATLMVGYGIYQWRGELFQWVGIGNLLSGFSFFGHLRHFATDRFEPWGMLFDLLSLGIGALAYFLYRNAFPKVKTEKDPLGGPARITFTSRSDVHSVR